MADWPALLPQGFEPEGYKETPYRNMVRTEMDFGPAKVRPRFTASVRSFQGTMPMTRTQLDSLETFWYGSLVRGTASFNFPHPRTGVTISVRFVEPPAIVATGPNRFKVSLNLEQLPT